MTLPTVSSLLPLLTGRNGSLRPSKPATSNGAVRFIWRIARLNSGQDVTMPVMAYFDLQDYADECRPDAKVSGIINDAGRALINECEALADGVVDAFGLSRYGAARAWVGLI